MAITLALQRFAPLIKDHGVAVQSAHGAARLLLEQGKLGSTPTQPSQVHGLKVALREASLCSTQGSVSNKSSHSSSKTLAETHEKRPRWCYDEPWRTSATLGINFDDRVAISTFSSELPRCRHCAHEKPRQSHDQLYPRRRAALKRLEAMQQPTRGVSEDPAKA